MNKTQAKKIKMLTYKLWGFYDSIDAESWCHLLGDKLSMYSSEKLEYSYRNLCIRNDEVVQLRSGKLQIILDIKEDGTDNSEEIIKSLEGFISKLIGSEEEKSIEIFEKKRAQIKRLEDEIKKLKTL